jgi:hypothetical protein
MRSIATRLALTGWALLWLLCMPIPILLVLLLLRGCT